MKLETLGLTPTSVANNDNRFHPAVHQGALGVHYWSNITYDTAEEAKTHAEYAITLTLRSINSIIEEWHMEPLT